MVLRRNGASPLVHLRDEMDRLMSDFFGPVTGLALPSRRNLLKAGLAGVAGLSLPGLMRAQAEAASVAKRGKSLILLWMTGGPSHIDTWDPKPDRPIENRGPREPEFDHLRGGVRLALDDRRHCPEFLHAGVAAGECPFAVDRVARLVLHRPRAYFAL